MAPGIDPDSDPAASGTLNERHSDRSATAEAQVHPVRSLFTTLVVTTVLATASSPVSAEEVWFSPNVASVDYLDLFSSPELWPEARSRIDVFKFDAGHVGSDGWSCATIPSEVCGENYLSNIIAVDAFNRLTQWGIDISIESFFAGPIMAADPITCSTTQHVYNLTLSGSINVIQNVEANGGTIASLAMDEPMRQWLPTYYYERTGQTDPRPCLADIDILADHMAAYLQQMAIWFPTVPIGHIDLYPEVSVDMFKEWVLALEARGVTIPFLHLDVNGPRVDQYNTFGFDIDIAADFAELETFLDTHGIEFGVIITDLQWNSQLWEPGSYTDQVYYDAAMDWNDAVNATGVELDDRIFQSWVPPYYTTHTGPKETPINLPEDELLVHSHTRLINDALSTVVAVGPDDTRTSLHQNFPNPFHGRMSVTYDVSTRTRVVLKVFDVRGREVQRLVDTVQPAGTYTVGFAAGDLSAGVYYYSLRSGDRTVETRKMVLLK